MVNGRCRNHGCLSTGAKTEEGKAAIRQALKKWMSEIKLLDDVCGLVDAG